MATKRQVVTIDVGGKLHYAEIQLSDGDRTDFQNGDPFAVDYVKTMIFENKPLYADLEFDETNVNFCDS
jgi:hypothetical protein